MKIGICAAPATIASFDQRPFDFIEGHVQNFLLPERPDAEFASHVTSASSSRSPLLAANCFLPADLKVVGPQVDHSRLAAYAATAFSRAASVGMDTIVFGSGGARQIPAEWSSVRGFEQFVEALRLVGPIAQRAGVMLVVEPLNRGECNLVNTIDEGAEAVRQADHPSVLLLVDLYHMGRNGEGPEAIERHAELISHAHIAEVEGRTPPGFHGEDFRPFLRALGRAHGCRRITLECNYPDGMETMVGPAVAALRAQLAEVGLP
jgi:sugar phosphate isomerase/epimerase